MRKMLLVLSVTAMALSATGCCHNWCGGARGGNLFGFNRPAAQVQYAYPPATNPCCDPCATGQVMAAPQVYAQQMYAAPTQAPCCSP